MCRPREPQGGEGLWPGWGSCSRGTGRGRGRQGHDAHQTPGSRPALPLSCEAGSVPHSFHIYKMGIMVAPSTPDCSEDPGQALAWKDCRAPGVFSPQSPPAPRALLQLQISVISLWMPPPLAQCTLSEKYESGLGASWSCSLLFQSPQTWRTGSLVTLSGRASPGSLPVPSLASYGLGTAPPLNDQLSQPITTRHLLSARAEGIVNKELQGPES